MDDCLGRVIQALEQGPHAANTLIIIASDHGYHLGEKNRFAKMALWDRSSRVPLIVSGPAVKENTEYDGVVSLIDLYPTLIDYCGLKANKQNEGKSFSASFKEPDKIDSRSALTTMSADDFAITQGDLRYYRYHDGSEELYNLVKDPNEWTNLAKNLETQPLRQKLKALIPKQAKKPISSMHHNKHFKSKKKISKK